MKPINCLVTATVAVALAVPVQAQVDCANWNTRDFFKAAEVSDVIRCLEAGADPNERTDGGWTPLYFAGSAEAVTALLEAGADPMARSLHGGTPLHWATTNEAVTALLQAGANLEARNENGLTPLHWATTSEAVTALLQAGANLEARDEYRGTPLHRAAELSKNPEVIKVMLDAGADTAALNAAGKTPWDLVQVNDALKGSDAYWRLNDARFKSSDSVFRIGGDVSAPRLTYKVEPEYSEEARNAKHKGTVVLAIQVWEDGRAHNIRVIRSLGLGLDEKAIQAVQKWKFVPGKKDGIPVKVRANVDVNFRLL